MGHSVYYHEPEHAEVSVKRHQLTVEVDDDLQSVQQALQSVLIEWSGMAPSAINLAVVETLAGGRLNLTFQHLRMEREKLPVGFEAMSEEERTALTPGEQHVGS